MVLSSAPVFHLLCEKYIHIKYICDTHTHTYIYIYIYIYIFPYFLIHLVVTSFHAKEVREGKRRHKLTESQRSLILR